MKNPELICLAALALFVSPGDAIARQRPNVVVVLADDLGYGDLGCYGEPNVQTPHLDQFAQEGLRFTNCYAAAASCSPARTGLMTGRTPYRVGVYSAIPFLSPMHLRASEITIATLLGDAGYSTCHVGKWHLGGWFNLPGQPQPDDHGFDHWFSTQNNALPNHRNPYNFVRNAIPVGPLEGYAGDLVADEAIDWLRRRRDESKPFFLYVCFHEPHEPIATAERYTKLYEQFPDPSQRAYYGSITQMDAAFGRLMRELTHQRLHDNTLVFFTSDNGPALTRFHPYGSTGPLRAKKGHMYEGGIRVPGMLRWPGHASAGQVSDEPISGVDLLPTLCAVTGIPVPGDRTIDGASFLPVIEGDSIARAKPLYWQYNRAGSEVKVALRDGNWKILARLEPAYPRAGADVTAEQMKLLKSARLTDFELYNLDDDIGESTDLVQTAPERFAAMKEKLVSYYREVQSENPLWPAWKSPRYESGRIQWPEYKALRKPPK
ncbi:sulfatase-like hydrolase/transferase [Planctomycetota bacterium]